MGTNSLRILVCKDAEDAIAKGLHYASRGDVKGLSLDTAVVVQNGTSDGRPTVDLILVDPETGQHYVALITGRLLRSIPL